MLPLPGPGNNLEKHTHLEPANAITNTGKAWLFFHAWNIKKIKAFPSSPSIDCNYR